MYNYDIGCEILLREDFVKKYMPILVDKDGITFTVQQSKIVIPVKRKYAI